jgi:phosphoribosylformimino-5-aminoimidazole carboxamide ribotide isomerase
MQIVPSIDLRNGQVVRLKQGDYGQQITYDLDPADVARSFAAAGATWMHIVDLDGAREGRPVQTELIARIAAASGLQVQVGGGIRTEADIDALRQAGVARVVIGTRAMEKWDWFKFLVHEPQYEERIVLALDARDGVVATRGWTESSGRQATTVAAEVSNWPLAGILYTDVAKDGMLSGPNFDATCAVAEAGNVPVIASGGVGNLNHIKTLCTLPVWGTIVGRSLYEGKVDLAAAIREARR